MKSTVCSGVHAAAGFSVRPLAVNPVKTKPGIRRCALSRASGKFLKFVLQGLRESLHTGLGDVVGGISGRGRDALLRTGVDDQARASALDHAGDEDLRTMDDTPQIDADHIVPVRSRSKHPR